MAKSSSLLLAQEHWGAASKLPVRADKPLLNELELCTSNIAIQNSLCRGSIAEISGRRSSGRTSLCLHILAQATARGEVCAVVDMHSSFHPASAYEAGVQLEQVVWARCQGDTQHTLRTTDLLLHAGGFGVVLVDLCEASPQALNRIPISYWYRLRRAVENTPTVLLVCSSISQVKCSSVNKIELKHNAQHWAGKAPFLHFEGLETSAISSKASDLASKVLFLSAVA